MNEKIIQISSSNNAIYALSNEGQIYAGIPMEPKGTIEWVKIPEIDFPTVAIALTAKNIEEKDKQELKQNLERFT